MNILEISSAGAGFLDVDQDGWMDVVLAGPEGATLFRNLKGVRFERMSGSGSLDSLGRFWHGCASGDVDNDGWPDLLLTGYGRQKLLRNASGRFQDVTVQGGITLNGWGTSASFFDADRDGLLDLVIGRYVHFRPGMPEFMTRNGVKITLGPDAYDADYPRFYRNLGGFRFQDRTRASGFHTTNGKTFGTAVCDYDDDGDDDVYFANDEMPGNLFTNDGKGRFTDRGVESGTAFSGAGTRQGGMGVAWGDWDGDQKFDLLVTTFTQEPKSLYRNEGGGFFTESSHRSQLTQGIIPWVGFGVVWFDADLDGDQDVAMVNGHVEDMIHQVDAANDYPQPMKLFENRAGQFVDVSDRTGDGFRASIVGRGLATGDFDNDGDIDLLAADLEGGPRLLRNESQRTSQPWIGLRLLGSAGSNRQAIGSRLKVESASVGLQREVRTDGSYLSCHDPRILLGHPSGGAQLIVTWPNGRKEATPFPDRSGYYDWIQGRPLEPVVATD